MRLIHCNCLNILSITFSPQRKLKKCKRNVKKTKQRGRRDKESKRARQCLKGIQAAMCFSNLHLNQTSPLLSPLSSDDNGPFHGTSHPQPMLTCRSWPLSSKHGMSVSLIITFACCSQEHVPTGKATGNYSVLLKTGKCDTRNMVGLNSTACIIRLKLTQAKWAHCEKGKCVMYCKCRCMLCIYISVPQVWRLPKIR